MDRTFFAVGWYRFRATFARRWPGYLAITLLVGFVGGLGMGSISGARRTQSSYPTFLASTNPSDLSVAIYNPATNGGPGPSLTNALAHLRGVERVRSIISPAVVPLTASGAPRLSTLNYVVTLGSLDGEFFEQDRLAALRGRPAYPSRLNEIMMTASAARILGAHVGEVLPLGFYTPAQESLPGFGTPKVAPKLLVRARVVGIVTLNNQVVQDDIDQAYGFIVVTPALLRAVGALAPGALAAEGYELKLGPGRNVTQVEQSIVRLIPPHLTYEFHVTSGVVTDVELAIKPESVAFGAFGAIAALVALALGVQAIGRQLRFGDAERQVLRAIGSSPATAGADGLIGVLAALVLGALLAVGIAVALSPLSPIGPVRPVYPGRGIAADWTVLGLGFGVLVVGLGTAAVALSYHEAPHRRTRTRVVAPRSSTIARRAEDLGVPVTGVVGVRFALESGRGRTAVPVRSALAATAMAVVLLVATLTFASGLHTLVSSPALYGWNWSYMLNPSENVPQQSLTLLDRDPDVAAWTGIAAYTSAELNGLTVPFLVSDPDPKVAPPILSGHGLDGKDQIVLGETTLGLLHKHVGDSVLLSVGAPKSDALYIPPTPVQIVGIATFPAVGYSSFVADHTSMGTGAMVSTALLPRSFLEATKNADPNLNGPQLVFVRLKPSVSATAGRANLQRIADSANHLFANDPNAAGNFVTVLGVQRPVQIVNYRSIGSTPVLLAVALALGAIVGLALTLIASVRRRRPDLALLKALGFTPRQLAAVLGWQSTVVAVIGVIVGVPLGIVLGRQLWTLFARNINAVPDATVPLDAVLLVALGALVFANLVATIPGRLAARTSTARVLRAE